MIDLLFAAAAGVALAIAGILYSRITYLAGVNAGARMRRRDL